MRKTRRPVILNEPTWMITDIAITTNSPPRIARSRAPGSGPGYLGIHST